jgi:hypothetical protein
MSVSTDKTVQAACLLEPMAVLLAESLDAAIETDDEISFVGGYAPLKMPDDPWRAKAYEGWVVVSVCHWPAHGMRCVLSREGETRLYGPGGKPDHTFQLPEAGVFNDSATGLGYVNRIRAIGSTLYVCGQSRQVWRFEWDGKHLSRGRWVDAAGPMRQPPLPEPEGPLEGGELDNWLDSNDAIDLVDINGPADDDLYAVGDEAWHFDGRQWTQLTLPTDEPLAAIKVLDAERIVFAGHNGTLLLGSAQRGFTELSSTDDHQNFTGVEWFEGKLYLASNLGLFVYDTAPPERERRIERCHTGLKPELQDAHQLEAMGGVLWSFGFKDLAWFDARGWTRVDHPDNPPIR